mmetsp:Transcript_21965/g.67886  ORF Transcript_21965/g.67886 Transcript_21965/m.67886 type:complete len:255 (+) Transcript_21965:2057-2821(+)
MVARRGRDSRAGRAPGGRARSRTTTTGSAGASALALAVATRSRAGASATTCVFSCTASSISIGGSSRRSRRCWYPTHGRRWCSWICWAYAGGRTSARLWMRCSTSTATRRHAPSRPKAASPRRSWRPSPSSWGCAQWTTSSWSSWARRPAATKAFTSRRSSTPARRATSRPRLRRSSRLSGKSSPSLRRRRSSRTCTRSCWRRTWTPWCTAATAFSSGCGPPTAAGPWAPSTISASPRRTAANSRVRRWLSTRE